MFFTFEGSPCLTLLVNMVLHGFTVYDDFTLNMYFIMWFVAIGNVINLPSICNIFVPYIMVVYLYAMECSISSFNIIPASS
jgi:hypothetical protein